MKNINTLGFYFIRNYFILPFLALFIVTASCSDDDNNIDNPTTITNKDKELIDTRGLDFYLKNAEKLRAGTEPSETEWNALFETPAYKLLIENGFFTKEEIKENMKVPYQQQNLTPDEKEWYAHHLEYRANFNQLKAYSAQLKDGTIRSEMRRILYPFLPIRLQNENLIPVAVYSYYIGKEANGYSDQMIIDGLLSYQADFYAKGVLGAHEAFHSVCTNALNKRKKITFPETDTRQIVLSSLEAISQEGIADLIDKDVLGQPDSPVYELFLSHSVNEQQKSINFITTLNTTLEGLSNGQTIPNANAYKKSVLDLAGHQPGRYMGRAIRQAGSLNALIIEPENPFAFFYTYNTVARRLGNSNYPVFSDKTIDFLKQLESQLIRPL